MGNTQAREATECRSQKEGARTDEKKAKESGKPRTDQSQLQREDSWLLTQRPLTKKEVGLTKLWKSLRHLRMTMFQLLLEWLARLVYTAVTKPPRLGDLNKYIHFSQFWSLRSSTSRTLRIWCLMTYASWKSSSGCTHVTEDRDGQCPPGSS